jgi:hypothetical protein
MPVPPAPVHPSPPSRPCSECGGRQWQRWGGGEPRGGWVCTVCGPREDAINAAKIRTVLGQIATEEAAHRQRWSRAAAREALEHGHAPDHHASGSGVQGASRPPSP